MRRRDLGRLERGRYDPTLELLRQLTASLDASLEILALQLENEQLLAEIGGPRNLLSETTARRQRPRRTITSLSLH